MTPNPVLSETGAFSPSVEITLRHEDGSETRTRGTRVENPLVRDDLNALTGLHCFVSPPSNRSRVDTVILPAIGTDALTSYEQLEVEITASVLSSTARYALREIGIVVNSMTDFSDADFSETDFN